MAVDTCRGEKPQSHQPKMLEDGKKAALIGGATVHFVIGDGCFPAGHRAEVRLFEARQSQFSNGQILTILLKI